MDDLKREKLKGLISSLFFLLKDETHDTTEGLQAMVSGHIKRLEKEAKSPRSRAKLTIMI